MMRLSHSCVAFAEPKTDAVLSFPSSDSCTPHLVTHCRSASHTYRRTNTDPDTGTHVRTHACSHAGAHALTLTCTQACKLFTHARTFTLMQ